MNYPAYKLKLLIDNISSRAEVRAIGEAAARFLDRLPALVLAFLCLRAAELMAGRQPGAAFAEISAVGAEALAIDLLSLVRYLPLLFLFSLPCLLIRSRRLSFWLLGFSWSLLVLSQAALIQYFLTARVPLGADLFAYSWREVRLTVAGGTGLDLPVIAGLALSLAALWAVLLRQGRRLLPAVPPLAAALTLAVSLLVLAAAPRWPGSAGNGSESAYNLSLNKAAFFLDDSLPRLLPSRPLQGPGTAAVTAAPSAAPVRSAAGQGFRYLDPAYPFLRTEQTPDALGPYFKIPKGSPPNLVFIIVEGLGRSFSGPGAVLGSFTPRLDQLAAESLYWENFLAVQGRTFGVLPSLFGSLPFGEKGFADLGERMPAHASLLSVLKGQGYRFKFYSGFDLHFDNEDQYLVRQGADVLVGMNDFGPGYKLGNNWGYGDSELVSRMLGAEAADAKQPYVSVMQTITMHTPYTFPGQERFNGFFEQRLDELGVPEDKKAVYRTNRNIYTSIMYTDEALGRFFEESKKNPAYQNTIFILTGDHRLPEIPMWTRIDRYHVPLLIYSPLLKAPARIKAVSSHFDVAPSLLAFLSNNYGVKTPEAVTWLGSGLDLDPSFRNLHSFPLKQTRSNLVDFVSGTWYVNQGALYLMHDGLDIETARDPAALAGVQAEFASFRAANDKFARTLALTPGGGGGQLSAYRSEARVKASVTVSSGASTLSVSKVRVPEEAKAGELAMEAVFTNAGAANTFVPLIVMLTADGREVTESYGPLQKLPKGGAVSLKLAVKSTGVPPGRYFLAIFPSDPTTGKRVGAGRFHLPVNLRN